MRPLTLDWLSGFLLDLATPVGTALGVALIILSATMVAANALARSLRHRGIRNEADDPTCQ